MVGNVVCTGTNVSLYTSLGTWVGSATSHKLAPSCASIPRAISIDMIDHSHRLEALNMKCIAADIYVPFSPKGTVKVVKA